MKGILEFSLPEENQEFGAAIIAQNMRAAISDIGDEVFRPARKHGYADEELRALVDKSPDAVKIISILEKKFYEILDEWSVSV